MKNLYDVFPKKITAFGILILLGTYFTLIAQITKSKALVSEFYRKDVPGLELYCGASRLVSVNQTLVKLNSPDTVSMKLNQDGLRTALEELLDLNLHVDGATPLSRNRELEKFLASREKNEILSHQDLARVNTMMADYIESYLARKNKMIEKEDHVAGLIAIGGISGMILLFGIIFYIYRLYHRNLADLVTATDNLERQRAISLQSAKLASLGEMAGGIAHEINNPLAIISVTTLVLRKKIASGVTDLSELTASLEQIDNTVHRISKIIKGLKNISRNSDGDPHTHVRLMDILEDVLAVCSERMNNANVKFEVDDPENSRETTLFCNRTQLSQVLINLILNSFDAVVENSGEKWISLKLRKNQDNFIFSISDSGRPIAPVVREKLFRPFFTTKEAGKGTGLGLAISKTIVESHKGKLHLSPRSDRNEFILELPIISGKS